MRLLGLGLLLAASVGGCVAEPGRRESACIQATATARVEVGTLERVDLLFMIDNSNSTASEQFTLIREFPTLLNLLATGDFNQNGSLDDPGDFRPVRDLQVGVITPDLGVGGVEGIASCTPSDLGDDGLLQRRVTRFEAEAPQCYADGAPRRFPLFLTFTPASIYPDDAVQLARDFSCVASVGSGGCGFEQPLESLLKAASPFAPTSWTRRGYVAPDFLVGVGHADGANAGLIRDDSVLAIVMLTNEQDCSARDVELFDPRSETYGAEDFNTRCLAFEEQALFPVERYVDGLLGLRRSPSRLVFSAIVGVPGDLAPPPDDTGPVDVDRILRDVRMQDRRLEGNPSRPIESCQAPGVGIAFPPRRIARVAQGLQDAGAGVTLQTICSSSYGSAMVATVGRIRSALDRSCLPRPLAPTADGSIDCEVWVDLAPGARCADVPGWDGRTDGASACRVQPLVPSAADREASRDATRTAAGEPSDGWFYDDYTGRGEIVCAKGGDTFQRIALTAPPPPGCGVRLECPLAVLGGEEPSVGRRCDGEDAAACGGELAPDRVTPLACDDGAALCGVRCDADADCVSAGLVGFRCDLRSRCEADRRLCGTPAGNEPRGFCVSPECGE